MYCVGIIWEKVLLGRDSKPAEFQSRSQSEFVALPQSEFVVHSAS